MLFNQNVNAISQMIAGQLLPHPSLELANVLAVTFVGSHDLLKSWLKLTFRVQRDIIRDALLWLKTNNVLYEDVVICTE